MTTVGSLFSGIGGFDLAAERAGMVVKWQVEIDPWCQRVLAKHWPDVERYSDVRDVGKHNLRAVDLICGGFPCQPFSVAGKQGGARDDRYLWPEMRRIIAELRPRWVVAENVPGIINLALDTVLSDLEAEGYEVGTLVLSAASVGAWHRRDRVWIVAHAGSDRCGADNGRESLHNEDGHSTSHATGWQEQQQGTIGAGDVSDANGRQQGRGQQPQPRPDRRNAILAGHGAQGDAADAAGIRREGNGHIPTWQHMGQEQAGSHVAGGDWWETESQLCGVPDGVSAGLDRCRVNQLKGLGNAIVPQVAEALLRWIAAIEAQR